MPLSTHAHAEASLFEPPLSCIKQINIRDFTDKLDRDIEYPEEQRCKPPIALKIDNEDGSPITVRKSIVEFQAYVQHNMQDLRRIKGEMCGELVKHADGIQGRIITHGRPVELPEDIRFYFNRAMPYDRDDSIGMLISLHTEDETEIA
jgi:hypothetical protein